MQGEEGTGEGGEAEQQEGEHVDRTAETQREKMRRCLLFTRRLIDRALQKLGEIPENEAGTL